MSPLSGMSEKTGTTDKGDEMESLDFSEFFGSDLDQISQDVLNLDISADDRTFEDEVKRIQANLDKLVETKKNLAKLEKAYLTGQI